MAEFVIVSFYTENTPYEKEAKRLRESLERHNLTYDIRPIPSLKNWRMNCSRKPFFIREMMDAHPEIPLVWLDADATVESTPTLFGEIDPEKFDIAVHFKGVELLSGTVWLSGGPGSVKLVEAWMKLDDEKPLVFDQVNLRTVVDRGGFKVFRLPKEYTFIFDLMKTDGQVVVLHHQASRRLSKLV
jgi:hypothetical protein